MLSFLGIVLGVLLLVGGGTSLVAGASQTATRLGVSPMIVGLTIVGFGTSMPELVVNVLGAWRGETDLAFGNVIGSNISNLALVLGAAGFIRAIEIHGTVVRREVPLLLLVTAIISVMAADGFFENLPGRIGRIDSVVLLMLFLIFLYIAVNDVMNSNNVDTLISEIDEHPVLAGSASASYSSLLILIGFVLMFAGGHVTVKYAVSMASDLEISTTVVGLFVVAIGTSMPELVTSIVAALRGESDLALGNIIGSNIFNSLIVLPASGVVGAIVVPEGGTFDLVVSLLLTAILIPIFVFGRAKLGKASGALLLALYAAYAIVRISGFS